MQQDPSSNTPQHPHLQRRIYDREARDHITDYLAEMDMEGKRRFKVTYLPEDEFRTASLDDPVFNVDPYEEKPPPTRREMDENLTLSQEFLDDYQKNESHQLSIMEHLKGVLDLTDTIHNFVILNVGSGEMLRTVVSMVHKQMVHRIIDSTLNHYMEKDAFWPANNLIDVWFQDNDLVIDWNRGEGSHKFRRKEGCLNIGGEEVARIVPSPLRHNRCNDLWILDNVTDDSFVILLNVENPWRQILGRVMQEGNFRPAVVLCQTVDHESPGDKDRISEPLKQILLSDSYEAISILDPGVKCSREWGEYDEVPCLPPLSLYYRKRRVDHLGESPDSVIVQN